MYADPAPTVLFRDFGDSALAFELRFFTHLDYYLGAPSDVRFRIDELFRENGVSIPFPQRDVHISGDSPSGTASASASPPPDTAGGTAAEQPS